MIARSIIIAVAAILGGCAYTRLEIPARIVNPELPADTAPIIWKSQKNTRLEVVWPDGAKMTFETDAASVNKAQGDAWATIITATGRVVTLP